MPIQINGTTVIDDSRNITNIGNVDGRDVSADGTKLDTIETNAKDDQTITAGSGLTGGGTGNVTLNIGAGTGITVNANDVAHADTSSQASVNNSGRTYIQDVTLDGFGHVTGLTSATETVVNTETESFKTITVSDTNTGFTWSETGSAVADSATDTLTLVSGSGFDIDVDATSDAILFNHADTSTLSGDYGSTADGTKIDTITLDGFGHVTAVATGATGAGNGNSNLNAVNLGTGTVSASNIVSVNSDAGTDINISVANESLLSLNADNTNRRLTLTFNGNTPGSGNLRNSNVTLGNLASSNTTLGNLATSNATVGTGNLRNLNSVNLANNVSGTLDRDSFEGYNSGTGITVNNTNGAISSNITASDEGLAASNTTANATFSTNVNMSGGTNGRVGWFRMGLSSNSSNITGSATIAVNGTGGLLGPSGNSIVFSSASGTSFNLGTQGGGGSTNVVTGMIYVPPSANATVNVAGSASVNLAQWTYKDM